MADLFVSHASEDKERFVTPFVNALIKRGLDVWYDDYALRLGDSLATEIDRGLTQCRFGVVVLSERFFDKHWPQQELAALVTRFVGATDGGIIPIWLGIDRTDVASHSAVMADRVALRADPDDEVGDVATRVARRVRGEPELSTQEVRHHDETVRLWELQRDYDGALRGHRFVNCIVVGPAVLGPLNNVSIRDSTLDELFYAPHPHGRFIGTLRIADIAFEGCLFIDVGMMKPIDGPPASYYREHWNAGMEPPPAGAQASAPARNAPCSCGSGRKYKHCHGRN